MSDHIIIMIFYGVLDIYSAIQWFEVKRLSVELSDQVSRLNWSGQQNFPITCTMGPSLSAVLSPNVNSIHACIQ